MKHYGIQIDSETLVFTLMAQLDNHLTAATDIVDYLQGYCAQARR